MRVRDLVAAAEIFAHPAPVPAAVLAEVVAAAVSEVAVRQAAAAGRYQRRTLSDS